MKNRDCPECGGKIHEYHRSGFIWIRTCLECDFWCEKEYE